MAPLPTYSLQQAGLLYHLDLADSRCWDPTRPEVIHPLPTPAAGPRLLELVDLPDYGLTGVDTGLSQNLEDGYYWDPQLTALGYPYRGSDTFVGVSGDTQTGNYALLGPSYYQGPFKLHGYPVELLPTRYNEGFTLETSLLVGEYAFSHAPDNTSGFFLYLGARAENKFYDLPDAAQGGHFSSQGIPLGPDHARDPERGVAGNVLAFRVNGLGQICCRWVTDELQVEEVASLNRLSHPGWVTISLAYTPCFRFEDPDLLACAAKRRGVLRVYVNGGLFHEFPGFEEPWFQPLATEADKQLGVPYCLSWGGGSPGLRYRTLWGSDGQPYEAGANPPLLIQNYFDGQLFGGLQTLRIYNRPLGPLDVRQNHNYLAPRYGLPQLQGGRLPVRLSW